MKLQLVLLSVFFYISLSSSSPVSVLLNQVQNDKSFNGTIWALLTAGSNQWYNYRHQADVCHAFQVLREHGIPESNIVVMMYDDIAPNQENPTPGIIINKPGGKDVYKGVPKDYTQDEVTPENFLKVLAGDEELTKKGKKVIKSGPNDHVFVYFSDHGAPGLVGFPTTELTATQLNDGIKKMHRENRYKKMVLYIEACESGSMFDGLLANDINVYATTAANSTESSYACYYDNDRDTYLGDLYSVNWIEDSDARSSLTRESLEKQFEIVKKETNASQVEEFGDLNIAKLPVSEFQGYKTHRENRTANCGGKVPIRDLIPSPDVYLSIAAKKLEKASETEKELRQSQYDRIISARSYLESSMEKIVNALRLHLNLTFNALFGVRSKIIRHECYERLYRAYDQNCFDLSTHSYALRYLYVFVNYCENVNQANSEELITRAESTLVNLCKDQIANHEYKNIH
jgi:legumain